MSRKRVYSINRFDGGITDDLRTSDLSKCAHVSHFDIYRDPNKLYPMPGYVSDQDTTAGGADDLKNYNVKAFWADNGSVFCVGTKSNGTGTKMFSKASAETANWTAMTNGEGTDDLADNTFLMSDDSGSNFFFVTNAGGSTYLAYHQNSVGTTDKHATLQTITTTLQHVSEYAFDGTSYFNTGQDDIGKIVGTTVTDPAKDTGLYVTDITSGDEQIGIMGYRFYPYKAQLLLWDTGSTLADQKIEFGDARESALGYVGGYWIAVLSENIVPSPIFDDYHNGEYSLSVKYASAGGARKLVRLFGKTNTNGKLIPLRSKHKDTMLFYARIPQDATPTTYKEGIWAVGLNDQGIPALSLLLDTVDLGSFEGHYSFGKHHYFAHGGDGSVSRLDNLTSGTYDVEAEYHSVMLGHDSPYKKHLNGVTINTEDLPSGGSVELFYRLDENDSWTTFGTSSTTGDEQHTFTQPSASPIGEFHEIQLRVVITGNVPVKGIHASITELDDLSYDS